MKEVERMENPSLARTVVQKKVKQHKRVKAASQLCSFKDTISPDKKANWDVSKKTSELGNYDECLSPISPRKMRALQMTEGFSKINFRIETNGTTLESISERLEYKLDD